MKALARKWDVANYGNMLTTFSSGFRTRLGNPVCDVALDSTVPLPRHEPWTLARSWLVSGQQCGILAARFREHGGCRRTLRLGYVPMSLGHPWYDLPNYHRDLADLRAFAWLPVTGQLADVDECGNPMRFVGVLTLPASSLGEALHGPQHLEAARRVLSLTDLALDDDVAYTLASAAAVVLAAARFRTRGPAMAEQCLEPEAGHGRGARLVAVARRQSAAADMMKVRSRASGTVVAVRPRLSGVHR